LRGEVERWQRRLGAASPRLKPEREVV